jgi:hypothetical protein
VLGRKLKIEGNAAALDLTEIFARSRIGDEFGLVVTATMGRLTWVKK